MKTQKYIWIVRRDLNWGQRGERPYDYLYLGKPISEKTLERRLKELVESGNKLAEEFYEEGLAYKKHNGRFNTSLDIIREKLL